MMIEIWGPHNHKYWTVKNKQKKKYERLLVSFIISYIWKWQWTSTVYTHHQFMCCTSLHLLNHQSLSEQELPLMTFKKPHLLLFRTTIPKGYAIAILIYVLYLSIYFNLVPTYNISISSSRYIMEQLIAYMKILLFYFIFLL